MSTDATLNIYGYSKAMERIVEISRQAGIATAAAIGSVKEMEAKMQPFYAALPDTMEAINNICRSAVYGLSATRPVIAATLESVRLAIETSQSLFPSDVEIILDETEKDIISLEEIPTDKPKEYRRELETRILSWLSFLAAILAIYISRLPDRQIEEMQKTLDEQTSIIEQQTKKISAIETQNIELIELTQEQLDVAKELVAIIRDVYCDDSQESDSEGDQGSDQGGQEHDKESTQEQESNRQ